MSYPAPPGLKTSQPKSGSSTPQPHPSLPARPPPPASSLPPKPPSSNGPGGNAGGRSGGFSGFTGFKPRSVAAANSGWQQQPQSYPPTVSAGPAPPSNFPGTQPNYNPQSYNQQIYYAQPSQGQQPHYPGAQASYSQATPPQIRNPFPAPGQADQGRAGPTYDPELEAQIAQWQSAYMPKDEAGGKGPGRNRSEGAASAGGANAIPLGSRANGGNAINHMDIAAAAPANTGVAAVVAGPDGKQKTVVRTGGGQSWQDSSLLEWDPAHFRIFVGNLAGEVTDDSLLKAFSKYTSIQKARVIRDKRTTKSKGYGFVSFSDGDDYFQAAKEMQGKYIGSHPVLIKRSTTDIKVSNPVDKKKQFKGGKGGYDQSGRANTGAGISKKPAKTKGGLKILG